MDDERTITEQDLIQINRTTVSSSARVARAVGTSLIVIGAVGAAAWVWMEIRTQQNLGTFFGLPSGEFSEEPELSVVDRVSLATAQVPLLIEAGIVAGVGFLLRVVADHVQMAAGGSVTGLAVGDPWPGEEDDEEPLDPEFEDG